LRPSPPTSWNMLACVWKTSGDRRYLFKPEYGTNGQPARARSQRHDGHLRPY
jgi:hypothetical protein